LPTDSGVDLVQSGSLLHPLCIARRHSSPKANGSAEAESLRISGVPRPAWAELRSAWAKLRLRRLVLPPSAFPMPAIEVESRPAIARFASNLREKTEDFLPARDFSDSARSPTILPIDRRACLEMFLATGRTSGTGVVLFFASVTRTPRFGKPIEIPGRFCNKGVSHDPYSS
jgi:hypothetical protein